MHTLLYVLLKRLRAPLIVLVLVYSITILGFTLIPGVDDDGNIWYMDFFHAFYFVSFMGSTIGFGEIPYEFTSAQRMWATIGIYGTVVAWLFGIGSLLSTMQDPAIRRLLTDSRFVRRVKGITSPFYIVCGYGDTGKILVKALHDVNIQTVVIDEFDESIYDLELSDDALNSPGMVADAGQPGVLLKAGLVQKECLGVITLTHNDEVNLQIALSTYLLIRKHNMEEKRFISRVETRDAGENIASFGHNEIINPYETFANRLSRALHSPGMFILLEWMTGVPGEKLSRPLFPPRGRWILCGYGRFGKAVHRRLQENGIHVTVVEIDPEGSQSPVGVIQGRGTEADTLRNAGIHKATGIVAGTNNDANNLSILLTAQELNPDLFTVARQNRSRNDTIFTAVEPDLIMQRSSVIAHKIFALIRTPLIGDFIAEASQRDNDWANLMVSRIAGIASDRVPGVWEVAITPERAGAVIEEQRTADISLRDLMRDPKDREKVQACIPLLLKRGLVQYLVPNENMVVESGDRILFCGRSQAHSDMLWVIRNVDVLHYVLTGEEHPSSYLWKWIKRREQESANAGRFS